MTAKVSERLTISPEDIDPRHDWKRPLAAPGVMAVDFEERVDFRRLHRYRLGRARQALRSSELGALLVFDNNNIRYLTSTAIGEWARDKMCRYRRAGRGWRAAPVGFRVGGRTPSNLRAVAAAGLLSRGNGGPARYCST